MKYKITACLIMLGILLTMFGCGQSSSVQEESVPDTEETVVIPPEPEDPFEPEDAVPDADPDPAETEDTAQEESESTVPTICVALDEERQKVIDDLLGTEDPYFNYSVPVVLGEGDYVDEVNAIITDYYNEVLIPQCEVYVEGGWEALEKTFGEVLRCTYSWKAEKYNDLVSLMISRHAYYDHWIFQCYVFLPDGTKASREDILDAIGWTEEQFQDAITDCVNAYYPCEEELVQYDERNQDWVDERKGMTFQNLEETEDIDMYLTAEGELIIQMDVVPLAGPDSESVVMSAFDYENLYEECKRFDNSSNTGP